MKILSLPNIGTLALDGNKNVTTTDPVTFLTLLHFNETGMGTYETDYYEFAVGNFIQQSYRNSAILKVGIADKGNGRCKITISDGTTSVYTEFANTNNSVFTLTLVNLDCSSLANNCLWKVTVEGKAVSGLYELNRLIIKALATDHMQALNLVLRDGDIPNNNYQNVVVDTVQFPINYIIDNSCAIECILVTTFGTNCTGVVYSVRVSTQGPFGYTYEINSVSVSASGIATCQVSMAGGIANFIKVEIIARTIGGVSTLTHYELRLIV